MADLTEKGFIERLERGDRKALQDLKARAKAYAIVLERIADRLDAEDEAKGIRPRYKRDVALAKTGRLSRGNLAKAITADRNLFNRLNDMFTDGGESDRVAQAGNNEEQIIQSIVPEIEIRADDIVRGLREGAEEIQQQRENITAIERAEIKEQPAPTRQELQAMDAFTGQAREGAEKLLTTGGFLKSVIKKVLKAMEIPSQIRRQFKDAKADLLAKALVAVSTLMTSDRGELAERRSDLGELSGFLAERLRGAGGDPTKLDMQTEGRSKAFLNRLERKAQAERAIELPAGPEAPVIAPPDAEPEQVGAKRVRRRRQPRKPKLRTPSEVATRASKLWQDPSEQSSEALAQQEVEEKQRAIESDIKAQAQAGAERKIPSFSRYVDKAMNIARVAGRWIAPAGLAYLARVYQEETGQQVSQAEMTSAQDTLVRAGQQLGVPADVPRDDEPQPPVIPVPLPPLPPILQPPGTPPTFSPTPVPPPEPPKKDPEREPPKPETEESVKEAVREEQAVPAYASLKPKFISPSVEILKNTQPKADFDQFNAFGYVERGSEGDGIAPKDNPLKMVNMINDALMNENNLVRFTKKFGMNIEESIEFEKALIQSTLVAPPSESFKPFNPNDLFKHDSIFEGGQNWNPSYKDAYYAFSDIDALNSEIAASNLYGRDL